MYVLARWQPSRFSAKKFLLLIAPSRPSRVVVAWPESDRAVMIEATTAYTAIFDLANDFCGKPQDWVLISNQKKGKAMGSYLTIRLRKKADKPLLDEYTSKAANGGIGVPYPKGLSDCVVLYEKNRGDGEPWNDELDEFLSPPCPGELELTEEMLDETIGALRKQAVWHEKAALMEESYKVSKNGNGFVIKAIRTAGGDESLMGSYNIWAMCGYRAQAEMLEQVKMTLRYSRDDCYLTIGC